jgi:phospholipid/cholesterol/gamma-HCH transport system substrate-binding protein
VLVTAFVLLASMLWVRQADVSHRRQYVTARFRDVGNARVGNAAVIRGVRSGRIDRIELDEDGSVLVRMSLDRGTVLPSNPVVMLNESSLFGEWQATITERAALPRDESIQEQIELIEAHGDGDAIPGATLPDIAKLTVVAGEIAGDVAAVAKRVDIAFDDTAARDFRDAIHNFSSLSAALAQSVQHHTSDLDTVSTELQAAVRALNRTASTTQRIATRMDSSLTDGELRAILRDLTQSAAQLRQATSTIAGMANRLAATQTHLDGFLVNGDSVLTKINGGRGTIGKLVNDSSLYVASDSLVLALRALVEEVRANPRKFLSLRLF